MNKRNYIYDAVVTNVVDGDTVDVDVDLGFTVWVKIRLRLWGIDTMEINDKDSTKRELAQKAKQKLIDQLLNQKVVIESFKTDKYGRWLAVVYINGSSINQQLLDEGLAVEYKI